MSLEKKQEIQTQIRELKKKGVEVREAAVQVVEGRIKDLEAEHKSISKLVEPKVEVEKGEVKRFPSASEKEKTKQPGKVEEAEQKRPLITRAQRKRMEKKKEVKEKQINIATAKEAKSTIRDWIINRRKQLNLATYNTNAFVNALEQVTSKRQREVLPFIIEKTGVPKGIKRKDLEKVYTESKKDLEPVARQVQKWFDAGWQNMKKHIPDMSAEQIENYVTHIWDLNKKQKRIVTNWFTTQNRFLKKRYIATISEGVEKFGLTPKNLDIGEIIRIHDAVSNRAIENDKFVKNLMSLRKDGVPLVERADKAPNDWVLFDHPSLRKVAVIPGTPKMGEKVSPALKRILEQMGVAIGRRINPTAWGKPVFKEGEYLEYPLSEDPPEVRFQRFVSTKTIAHEIGHHLDGVLKLGDRFLSDYKSELYSVNRDRIEAFKSRAGKYDVSYAESTEEQIAEFFATVFTDIDTAYKLAPNATADVLERLKQDGVLSQLVDFNFEKNAKNLIEEQLNTMLKLPVKVHPDLVKPLKVIFDSRMDHPAINAYEMVNGVLKKTNLSISLFHHVALGETGIATMGTLKTANIYFNPVKIYKALLKGEYDVYKKETIARDAVSHGLQLGATHDIPVTMIQDKLNTLARKTKRLPVVHQTSKLLATFNEKWDKALWDYLHDTLKVYAYEHLASKIDPTKNIDKQKDEVAQFVNDTFGGQNWDMLMLSPKTVQIMHWSLLSPDWTLSTVRQGLSPTGIGRIHRETVKQRKKFGKLFWIKAVIYFGVGMNILNYTFRKWDEKENPQYYKDKKMTFWDRTMYGNVAGKKTNLFVGRYEDGTERYIRWGKQFREVPELLIDDTGFSPISAALKKVGSKVAPALQLTSQIATGKTLSGYRNDDIFGKKGWEKALGIFKTITKSPLPFASRNLLDKDREAHITDLAMPSSKGMTRYKSIELFKYAIEKKDERMFKEVYQDTLQNNLPAYTLAHAAITALKAEATGERNKKIKTVEDVRVQMKKIKNAKEFQSLKRRYIQIYKEQKDIERGINLLGMSIREMERYLDQKEDEKNER